MLKRIKKNATSYLFLAPWFCFFVAFMLIPFIMGIVYSFFDYDFVNMKFVGFDNYKYILSDPIFLQSIRNTVLIAVIVVVLTLIVSLFLSHLIVKQSKKFQGFSKVALYIPAVSSSVAIVAIWRWVFGPACGISSSICAKLGVTAIDWFGQSNTATTLVCLMVLTFSVGQPIVLYTAAMDSVPKTYYEAAEIDGASEWKQFFSITLPMVAPTTLYILVTSTIAMMQVFEVPMLLTSGGPQYSTTTILLLLYKTAFEYAKFGRAAAMGVVLFVIIGLIAIIQFKTSDSDITY